MTSITNSNLGTTTSRIFRETLSKVNDTWSDCKTVLWNTRSVSYLLCLLIIILFVSLILSWNKNFIIFISGLIMVIAVYGALIVSKQSCFGIFDTLLTNSILD